MPSIKFDAIVETAKVVSGFRDIQNAVRQTAERVEKEGKSIEDTISDIQKKFEFAIGGWSLGKFVNQMMQVRGQFQQTEMAFKTMLQSEEKANELMQQMIHTAAITPFGVEDVTEGAKQLLAFNVAADEVNDTLIRLGDVAAGMGINLSDMTMLYGTTIAKGKMDTQDLYQFLNRGIPIADSLAKVMGLDVSNAIKEVQKQIKAGKVTSDIFISAMKNMTSEGSKFGGLMEAQSKTITGQISNIEDAIEQMFNELGKSQEGVINSGLDIVSKLVDNWRTLGNVLLTVVAAYGAYKAVVLTMVAISKAQIALKSVQAFLSLATSIRSAADAMALFNLVSQANVLGLVVGAIAAAVAYFNLFGDSVADVAETTKKFGDEASKATNHVETLIAILNNADQNSKVYKDTIKELADIYSDYGITITKISDDESNLIEVKDEEIKKSQELVEQIRIESAERNRANAISSANEEYNKKVEDAIKETSKFLSDQYGPKGAGIAVGIQNIVTPEQIKLIRELKATMDGAKEGSEEWKQAEKKLNETLDEGHRRIKDLIRANGLNYQSVDIVKGAYIAYLNTLVDADDVYTKTINAINRGADATENFGESSTTAKDRLAALQKKLQGAGEDVHTLYNRVKELMQNYSQNEIMFKINFDAEIPSWMNKMDLPELGRLGKLFSALAIDLANNKKKGTKVNGKWMSTQEIAQRGYDYSKAADKKQTEEDEKKKEQQRKKEEAEEKKKKNAQKAENAKKKAAAEAKEAQEEAKKKLEAQRKAQEEVNDELRQLVQQNTDEEISQMKDGTAKKIKEIENYYQKRKEEITKQETEFKKKNKEAGKKEELTDAQSNALAEARSLAEKDYNQKLDEVNKEALTSMRDYLKEYGSLYQQKQAIAEEYEEKIAQAQTEGEKKSLMKQKEKALSNFDYESITMGIDWKGLMSGVGNMSKEMLKPMYDKLEAYTKTSEYQKAGSETQQKVVDLLNEMRSYLGTDQGATWQELAKTIEDFHKAVSDYQSALNKEQVAQANVKSAKLRLDNKEITQKEYEAILQTANELGEGVVNAKNKMDTLGVNLNSQTEAVKNYTSGLTAALNKLEAWKNVEGFSQVQGSVSSIDAFKGEIDTILPTLSEGIEKNIGSAVSSGLGSVMNSIGNTVTNLLGGLIGSIAKIPSLILNLVDSIKNFVTGILNSFTKLFKFEWLSDLVNSILEAVGNLIDTILDLPENLWHVISSTVVQGVGGLLNTVVGRIGNIVTFGALSSDGPASWFTNSNEKKVTEAIEDLTDRNELLQNSIEDLTSAMEDAYGSKATSYYEQAYKNQEESNRNYLEIAKAQAGYHSAHHSWNKDWGGFTSDELAWIKQNVKSDFNGDLFSLSPEEMKLLRGNVEIWERIQNTGEYGDRLTEKLDDYIDQAGKLEELTDKMKESLTQVSFDSMKESFISNLMDMTKSAEDFSDDFAEMMQKALLSYSMEDLINGDLKELYNDWSQAIKESDGQLTDEQINKLNNRYDAIVEEGLKRRDQWSKVTGYTGSSSQSASSGGWESMGQDTAEELNGRFTALQIAGESIAQNMESTISHMESIVTLGTSTNGAVLEIRNMMIMTNSYLEDMVKYAKLTYNEFGSKIDNINKRLKEI